MYHHTKHFQNAWTAINDGLITFMKTVSEVTELLCTSILPNPEIGLTVFSIQQLSLPKQKLKQPELDIKYVWLYDYTDFTWYEIDVSLPGYDQRSNGALPRKQFWPRGTERNDRLFFLYHPL